VEEKKGRCCFHFFAPFDEVRAYLSALHMKAKANRSLFHYEFHRYKEKVGNQPWFGFWVSTENPGE